MGSRPGPCPLLGSLHDRSRKVAEALVGVVPVSRQHCFAPKIASRYFAPVSVLHYRSRTAQDRRQPAHFLGSVARSPLPLGAPLGRDLELHCVEHRSPHQAAWCSSHVSPRVRRGDARSTAVSRWWSTDHRAASARRTPEHHRVTPARAPEHLPRARRAIGDTLRPADAADPTEICDGRRRGQVLEFFVMRRCAR
jgi:hypothetical protein